MQGIKTKITKEELEELYNKQFSMRKIASILGLNKTTIERLFKKFEIKTRPNMCGWELARKKRSINPPIGMSYCSKCKEYFSLEFFTGKKHHKPYLCKNCINLYDKERANVLKQKGIEYLGGKCKECGYNQHIAVFDFHHRIPTEKDVSWNKLRKRSWERIKTELDKCDLLCSNCHRIHHAINGFN